MEKGKDQRGTPERGEYTENILIETGEQWAIAIEKKKERYQYVWLVFCKERPSLDVQYLQIFCLIKCQEVLVVYF